MSHLTPEIAAEIDRIVAIVTEGLKGSLYLKVTPEQMPKIAQRITRELIWKRDEFRRLRFDDPTPVANPALPERQ